MLKGIRIESSFRAILDHAAQEIGCAGSVARLRLLLPRSISNGAIDLVRNVRGAQIVRDFNCCWTFGILKFQNLKLLTLMQTVGILQFFKALNLFFSKILKWNPKCS